jgi:hypothetical protein
VKKIAAIVFTLLLVLGLVGGPALAVDEETVTTQATVGGSGSPPFVCAKFETPDHDVAPDTQILPIPEGMRLVKFYVIVGDPNGVDDVASVDVTVRYPDGTEKFQLRAVRPTWTMIPWDGLIDMDGDCAGETTVPDALAQLEAEGRITYGPNQTPASVLSDLENGKQLLIELVGEMHYHQPSADYTVEAVATDAGGATGDPLVNTFFYMSIVALKIDFAVIDWQTVNVSEWNYVLGDEDMTTPARPTVQNVGNDPAKIQLHASPLTGVTHGKTIEEFDAEMDYKDPDTGAIVQEGRIEFMACVPTVITELADPTIPVLLPPCTPTQIDFSVHPPYGTVEDTYQGTMTITILHY